MKKLFLSTFALVALLVFLGSCKDDEKVDGGSFTVDGEKHSLKHAYAYYDGDEEDGDDTFYYWTVILTSSGLEFVEDDFVGAGDFLHMSIAALNTETEELPTGTFYFPFQEGKSIIQSASIILNVDTEDEGSGDENSFENVESATVVITKSGNRYSIKLTITLTDEPDFKASYSGSVELLED